MQAQKKIRQTDAIFGRLAELNPEADRSDEVLRISMDTKAAVKIGCFSRGGKSRLERKAWDHDFRPETILTPFGIFLPRFDDLSIFFTASTVTSDFIVDVLQRWWQNAKLRFPKVKTLVINQDNGGNGLVNGRDFGRLLGLTGRLAGSCGGLSAWNRPARHVAKDVERYG